MCERKNWKHVNAFLALKGIHNTFLLQNKSKALKKNELVLSDATHAYNGHYTFIIYNVFSGFP